MNLDDSKNLVSKFLSLSSWEELYYFIDWYQSDKIEEKKWLHKKDITGILFTKYPNYRSYHLPKKANGKTREIEAPRPKLRLLQKILSDIIQLCFIPGEAAHGFVKERSIVTNARKHVNRRYVYNADLVDFFPSIHFGRVRGIFQGKPFSFSREFSSNLANICCHKGRLPQGAPTSPVLSNLVCRGLDARLSKLAKTHNAIFSRYADDITFSSNQNIFTEAFATEFSEIVQSEGFSINESKTRLASYAQRQSVTGLIVNKKVNVSKNYLQDLKFLIWLYRNGEEGDAQLWLEKNYPNRHRYEGNVPKIEEFIEGKLNFLKMVVGEESERYTALKLAYLNLTKSDGKGIERKIEKLSSLAKKLKTTDNEEDYIQTLIEIKKLILEIPDNDLTKKAKVEAVRVFEDGIKAKAISSLTYSILNRTADDPFLSVLQELSKKVEPVSGGRWGDEPHTPLHLASFLQQLRSDPSLHPFGFLLHSTTSVPYCNVVKSVKDKFNEIGYETGKFKRVIPSEIYKLFGIYIDILSGLNEYNTKPYSYFFENEENLVLSFRKLLRFDTQSDQMSIKNILLTAFRRVLGQRRDIWCLKIQEDIDTIFHNLMTSTKNVSAALEKIFETCLQNNVLGAVKVTAKAWNNKVVLRIINIGVRVENKDPYAFLNDLGGDIKMIKLILKGYCDLNIRAEFQGGDKGKIKLLPSSKQIGVSENYSPEGFTYELIFYKPLKFLIIDDGDNNKRIKKVEKILKDNPGLENLVTYTPEIGKYHKIEENYNAVFVHSSYPEYKEIASSLLKNEIPFISFSGGNHFEKSPTDNMVMSDKQFYSHLERYLHKVSVSLNYFPFKEFDKEYFAEGTGSLLQIAEQIGKERLEPSDLPASMKKRIEETIGNAVEFSRFKNRRELMNFLKQMHQTHD